jgi:hypothetical protein
MCVVSNIGDSWKDQFPERWPDFVPYIPKVDQPDIQPFCPTPTGPSQSDFDDLKKEVEELKKLLKAAKAYDEATGQPHCEMNEKVDLIKRVAKMVGVNLEDVFDHS